MQRWRQCATVEGSPREELLKQLGRGWRLNGKRALERPLHLQDFGQALTFANKVGAVAEAEGHHPDLYVGWGKCKIEI